MGVMDWKKGIPIVLAVAMVLLTAHPALGISDKHKVPKTEPQVSWFAILYFVVGLAGICVVGFKNSHRTHLD